MVADNKEYKIVVLGDREFHGAKLAEWLIEKKVGFVFRQKKNTYIQRKGEEWKAVESLNVKPGTRLFFANLKITKEHQLKGVSMGIYWKRKYRGMGEREPWYLLTNLDNLAETIKAYKKRVGIEAISYLVG